MSEPATGEEFLDRARREGALVSGDPVPPGFQRGWGCPPFQRGMKAHHWTATTNPDAAGVYGIRSACGLFAVATPRVPLLGHGNLPFCVRCENRLMRERS